MERKARVERVTGETSVMTALDLDGSGNFQGKTGVGFFDHMLHLLTAHALFDLELNADGDLEVDPHHTVEDTGICLGEAFRKALGDKKGIIRYGSLLSPMDETLVMVAVDLSGRPYLGYQVPVPAAKIGELPVELVPEFFRAFSNHALLTLHIRLVCGENSHHIIEAVFKGVGRALRQAVGRDDRRPGIPSTKGKL